MTLTREQRQMVLMTAAEYQELLARAERAEAERDEAVAKVARVVALVTDWEAAHTHLGIERGNWGPPSSSLRAALDIPATEGGEGA